jgi:nucleotide-binding universal stress UspA family protein
MEARLQAALDLARQFDGFVTCLQASPYDLGVPGDFYGTKTAQLMTEYEEQALRLRNTMEERLKAEDVRWTWVHSERAATMMLAGYAPLNDIVLLGGRNEFSRPERPSELAIEMVFTMRAPILIMPAEARTFALDAPAIVAWNGAAEAAHALRAAMPLLLRASDVHILTVKEQEKAGSFDIPPIGAAKYLARYGIEAEIVELPRAVRQSVAEPLLDAAMARKGGYLVMGAYGHSRLRERVLGGVTRDMLSDPQIPLLVSH